MGKFSLKFVYNLKVWLLIYFIPKKYFGVKIMVVDNEVDDLSTNPGRDYL